MTRIPISNIGDPCLAVYRDLRARSQARDPERFIAESELAVRRLLASGFPVESIVATVAHADRLADAVPDDVTVYVVSREQLSELVGYHVNRGCIACGRRIPVHVRDMNPLISRLARADRVGVVVAQRLADPVNVGAVVRSCRAFGIDLIVLDEAGADPYSRRAIRASMGHVFGQPIALASDLPNTVATLAAALDAEVVAATTDPAAVSVGDAGPLGRMILLLGPEGDGLGRDLLQVAHRRVTVPIDPTADSLNVAAAAAVALFALHPFRPSP